MIARDAAKRLVPGEMIVLNAANFPTINESNYVSFLYQFAQAGLPDEDDPKQKNLRRFFRNISKIPAFLREQTGEDEWTVCEARAYLINFWTKSLKAFHKAFLELCLNFDRAVIVQADRANVQRPFWDRISPTFTPQVHYEIWLRHQDHGFLRMFHPKDKGKKK